MKDDVVVRAIVIRTRHLWHSTFHRQHRPVLIRRLPAPAETR